MLSMSDSMLAMYVSPKTVAILAASRMTYANNSMMQVSPTPRFWSRVQFGLEL